MHKRAAIAASALISISAVSPALAEHNKKSVAIVPGMVPHPPAAQVRAVPVSVRSSLVKQAAQKGYPSTHFQRGMLLKQQGNLDGALIEFLKAAQENPLQVRAFYEQALIFRQKGYGRLAQSALQQLLSVRPDFKDAHVMLASIFLENGNLPGAANQLLSSLGLVAPKQHVKMPPATKPAAGPPLKWPMLIQTPHGSMQLPSPPETPKPKTDPFESGSEQPGHGLPDLSALLQGLPNLNSQANGESPPNIESQSSIDSQPKEAVKDDAASAFTATPAAAPLPATEAEIEKKFDRRQRKKRVAAWLDNLLDGSKVPDQKETIHEPKAWPQPAATPRQPSPMDMLKRAIALIPLPVFKPMEESISLPSAVPTAISTSTEPPAPVPPPVAPAASTSGTPLLPPQAVAALNTLIGTPPPPAAQPAPPPMSTPSMPTPETGLDSVLAMLPKDIAATVQRVLGPQVVDIAPAQSEAPTIQPIVGPSAPREVAPPSPVAAVIQNVYENLVGAQVRSQPAPFVPTPLPQPQQTAAAAPAPAPAVAPLPTPSPIMPTARALDSTGAAGTPMPPAATIAIATPNPQPFPMARSASSPAPAPAMPVPRAVGTPYVVPNADAVRVSSTQMDMSPLSQTGANPAHYVGATAGLAEIASSGALAPAAPVHVGADAVAVANAPAPMRMSQAIPQGFTPLTSPVAQRLSNQGFKFVVPSLTQNQQYVYSTIKNAPAIRARAAAAAAATAKAAAPPKPATPPDDQFAKRMKYLMEHGTGQLGPGEAFMFSEETGEGVLFLPGGSSVRRKIANPRDAEEVARERRPDILAPQGELQYNLSLLGKIIKPQQDQKHLPKPPDSATAPPITVDDLLGKDEGFFGWFRNVFKF